MYLKNFSVSPISSFLDSEFLQMVFTGLQMLVISVKVGQLNVTFFGTSQVPCGESAEIFEIRRQCAKPAS